MFKFLSHLLDGGCTIVVGTEGGVVNGDVVGGIAVEGGIGMDEFYLEFAIHLTARMVQPLVLPAITSIIPDCDPPPVRNCDDGVLGLTVAMQV